MTDVRARRGSRLPAGAIPAGPAEAGGPGPEPHPAPDIAAAGLPSAALPPADGRCGASRAPRAGRLVEGRPG